MIQSLTPEQRELLSNCHDYCYKSKFPGSNGIIEGGGFLSALVNLVDTARENPELFQGTQAKREKDIVEFILSHHNPIDEDWEDDFEEFLFPQEDFDGDV